MREGGRAPAPTWCSSTSRTPARRSPRRAPGAPRSPPSPGWTGAARCAPSASTASTPPGATTTSSRSSPAPATRSTCSSSRRPARPATCGGSTCCSPSSRRSSGCRSASASRCSSRRPRASPTRSRSPGRATGSRRSSSAPATCPPRSGRGSTATSIRSASTPATSGTSPGSRWSPPPGPRASTPSTRPTPPTRTPTATGAAPTHASLLGLRRQVGHPPEPDPDRQRGVLADRRGDRRRPSRRSRIYRAAEAEGVGAIGRDGRLVDAAHMRLAENTLLQGVAGRRTKRAMSRALRVVQWATGNIGTRSLRGVIEHPELELVGVHVTRRQGRARRRRAVRRSTRSASSPPATSTRSLALAPDCVLYMPRACDVDEVCRAARAGHRRRHHPRRVPPPASMDPAVRERVEAACARGRHVDPQHRQQPRVHHRGRARSSSRRSSAGSTALLIEEFADLSQRHSPELLFDIMGFGRSPPRSARAGWTTAAPASGRRCALLADALGTPARRRRGERRGGRRAPADVEIAAGTIEAGTVAAQRMTVTGLRDGRPLVQLQRHLVLHHRPRRRLGPARHRLAHRGRRRRPAGRRAALPVPARGDGRALARLHRQPRRQRGARGLRGATGHPHHRRPAQVIARFGPRS